MIRPVNVRSKAVRWNGNNARQPKPRHLTGNRLIVDHSGSDGSVGTVAPSISDIRYCIDISLPNMSWR
jgi:hypothetical protein